MPVSTETTRSHAATVAAKGLPACKFRKVGPLYEFRAASLQTDPRGIGIEYYADPRGRPYIYVPAKSYEKDLSGTDLFTGDSLSGKWGARPKGSPGSWMNPTTYILASRGEDGTTEWTKDEERYRDDDDHNNF